LEGYAGKCRWLTSDADLEDPVLDDFRSLKSVQTTGSEASIIAEGPEGIRMLLASDFVVDKLLVKPSLFETLRTSLEERAARRGEAPVLVLLCEAALMERITGVPARHASAVLASARRPTLPPSLEVALMHLEASSALPGVGAASLDEEKPLRVLAVEGLDDEAVGAVFRDAACFGVHLVLLSPDCGDPFSRRAARVAMGHVFRVPLLRGELPRLLSELQHRFSALTLAAAEPGEVTGAAGGACFLDRLGPMPRRWACAIGPDGPVVNAEVRAACACSVAVRMSVPGCVLGVGVLASVLLNGLAEREPCGNR